MRGIFTHIRSLIVARYEASKDNHPDLPWQGVSAFLFLRFFVPAILHPHLFGFWPGTSITERKIGFLIEKGLVGLTDEPVKRTLTQLAKVIQSLANLNTVS